MHNPELAALDRKITAELAPRYDENDGTENKQEQSQQYQSEVKAETTVTTVNVHTTDTPQVNGGWTATSLSNDGKYAAFSGSTFYNLIVN